MMCALTETNHRLSGVCSGAQDGYAAHKIAGSVKGSKVEFYFQATFGGNPLTTIVSGTLSEDRTKMDGDMEVQPMDISAAFTAVRETERDTTSMQAEAASAQTDAAAAQAWAAEAQAELATGNAAEGKAEAPDAGSEADGTGATGAATASATGTWKIDGDVMGMPVKLTCVIAEAEHKLIGSCTGAGVNSTPRALAGTTTTGAATAKSVDWRFDDVYQGQPITFSLSAKLDGAGTKMNGSMSVAPIGVGGTFVAMKQ
jgi:hypothetical protein